MTEKSDIFPGISNAHEVNQIDPLDDAGFEILSLLREGGVFNMDDEEPPVNRCWTEKKFADGSKTHMAFCWTGNRTFFYLKIEWPTAIDYQQSFIDYTWDVEDRKKRHKQINLPEPTGSHRLKGLFADDQAEILEILRVASDPENIEQAKRLSGKLKEKAIDDIREFPVDNALLIEKLNA